MLVFRSGDVLFLKGDFSFEKKVLLRLHQIELTSDPFGPSTIKGIVPVSGFCPRSPRRVMYRFTERGTLTGEDQYLQDSG
ncbi:hypothetical protein PVK06_031754 [Gossypium arboreum]|uniref:Uncharacterized protein n=1 Tax=Gossypium arboreum TaxID=29729 RepID=A0ABR0NS60_GOSAR|nr:hypothetical protein PVK06_031754 [Gossypium arboreum]